jgi:AraC-like DNA-binding protein
MADATITLDLLLRLLGLTGCVALAIVLARVARTTRSAAPFAWLAASVGAFLVTSIPGADRLFGVAIYPLTALCSTHAVWFWIAASALFVDGFTLRTRHGLALAGMAVAGVAYQSGLPFEHGGAAHRALGLAFSAAWLGFAALAPWVAFRGMPADLDEPRRRMRRGFVAAVALYLAVVVFVQLTWRWNGERTPAPLVLANLVVLGGAAIALLASFLRVRVGVRNWLDAPRRRAVALNRVEQGVLAALERRVGAERLYARPALALPEFATLLGTQEHILRRVINQALGFRNFNDFLHRYRLAEVARRLRDPREARTPVLTIALEAGYGSIGPFNRAFRDRFGMTPSEYRRAPAPDGLPVSDSA